MIIALTGSNGSIGKELLPFLRDLGHQVITISSSIAGDGKNNFSYKDLKKREVPFQVDIFIHLASINSEMSAENIQEEVQLVETVLASLAYLCCKKLIFFSSSKVYGDNSLEPNFYNEFSALNPQCNYGKAKKLCEETISFQSSILDIYYLILRLPPVINQSKQSNIGKLINISRKTAVIPSLAHGNLNQRSFISINNISSFFDHILKNPDLLEKQEIYNLCDNEYISLNELLSVSSKGKIFSLPMVVSKLFFQIPSLKNILIKIFGNFVLENKKLTREMGVKLETTKNSLSKIYK
jgi:UDP-glucose 4-epimerase